MLFFKEFKRFPAEMSGESKILFGIIADVVEIKIEFSVSFISQTIGVQIDLLGCQECINFK